MVLLNFTGFAYHWVSKSWHYSVETFLSLHSLFYLPWWVASFPLKGSSEVAQQHLLSLALKDIQHCKKGMPMFLSGLHQRVWATSLPGRYYFTTTGGGCSDGSSSHSSWQSWTPLIKCTYYMPKQLCWVYFLYISFYLTRIPRDWLYYFHFTDEEWSFGKAICSSL